jgi:SAM-dependent methyltransferase
VVGRTMRPSTGKPSAALARGDRILTLALGFTLGCLITLLQHQPNPSYEVLNIALSDTPKDTATNKVRASSSLATLESLLYKYGSDKSKDDHAYSNLYQMLFDPIRDSVKNVTEIGVSAGQSIQVWYHYFPNAQLYGIDILTKESTAKLVNHLKPRFHFSEVDVLQPDFNLESIGLYDETMDILVEDAWHSVEQQQALLEKTFRLVKPGGHYIIEDIFYTSNHSRVFHRYPEQLSLPVQNILKSNDCIFVDTTIGHRAWTEWKNRGKRLRALSHWEHDSYMLIIRKRLTPLPPVKMNHRLGAMKSEAVIFD